MSIQIIKDGKRADFASEMEAISYLANSETQGFSKYDYDQIVKTTKSNPKTWKEVDIKKIKEAFQIK